jgi:acetoacetyl-CoA synthetase
MSSALWTPSESRKKSANLTRFLRHLSSLGYLECSDFSTLYDWSTTEPERFWTTLWEFCGVTASRRWDTVLTDRNKMPGARWFCGSRLNFAENLLRRCDETEALVSWNEAGRRRSLTYSALHDGVSRLARALRTAGVQPGDRVAGFMPNIPETVIAMLATTSLGAVWSSCSPDFGISGVLDRFGQIRPTVLFAADAYLYKGKAVDCLDRVSRLLRELPSVRNTIVVPDIDPAPTLDTLPGATLWDDFLGHGTVPAIDFAQLPFDHPIYILYSSGTTGKPKCIVHGAGGTLLQHLKELVLHTDLRVGDRICYFTTCGWMMWNWLVSGLAAGATVVLYDGAPLHPRPDALFDLAAAERLTVFGTSAKYLAAAEKAGVAPARTHDLSHLATILSTGSPLAPESFDYVYRDVKSDVLLSSISGGTDIVSCFALGCPLLPVYRGELQCRGLGMKVAVYDDTGHPVRGRKGELVCLAPFPSMPIYFWDDPEGKRYHAAYFERFPGVWTHGDFAELTEHDGVVIHGRSDAVLNPGGVRIGTAEIYRQVETLPEVLEAIAVGQEWKGDVRIVLFVKLRAGVSLDGELSNRIRQTIRTGTSPRHVPAVTLQVADIPRTVSGKPVELAVRDVIHNRPVTNLDALANPEALEYFRDLPALTRDSEA